jgi:hypothetical protein
MVVSIGFVDRDNNHGALSYNAPVTALVADVYADAQNVAAKVAAISDATLKNISISYGATEYNPAQPAEASDVERKGVFTFRDAAGFSSITSVPSIKNTLVIDGTQIINAADADVAAFVLAMTGATLVAPPISLHGQDLQNLARARKTHRKSTKG